METITDSRAKRGSREDHPKHNLALDKPDAKRTSRFSGLSEARNICMMLECAGTIFKPVTNDILTPYAKPRDCQIKHQALVATSDFILDLCHNGHLLGDIYE